MLCGHETRKYKVIYIACLESSQCSVAATVRRAAAAGRAAQGWPARAAGRARPVAPSWWAPSPISSAYLSSPRSTWPPTSILTSLVSQYRRLYLVRSPHCTPKIKSHSYTRDRLRTGRAYYNARGRNCDIVISAICCMRYRSAASRPRRARSQTDGRARLAPVADLTKNYNRRLPRGYRRRSRRLVVVFKVRIQSSYMYI